ncbi:DUF4238 domain-containing protein [Clostridium perfringens]|uniref:DUF4238 domain-containing protein n=1 Tax=Clostridium perfringens TaxID=1502 RepID=UPI002AC68911|nr:DUF4238 domain-containing protein [Clostridium perfringens]MDZ5014209.1 DUF4238 domain-containing protein [Clostridium perfringens]
MKKEFKENKQITRNQHYVPRFYLKNFSKIKGSGKKEKSLISFYQLDRNLLRENIPTKSICYEEYFYGEDGKMEKFFSNKESEWASVINDIIKSNSYSLDIKQESLIKEFAIFQYCRTSATYKHTNGIISEIKQKSIYEEFNYIDKGKTFNENLEEVISISDILNNCEEMIKCIDDLKISIIKFDTTNKLITSDMPVIRINPFSYDMVWLESVGIVILFPISNEFMVMIYDSKLYKNCSNYMVSTNEQDVINLNKYQVMSVEERIMSNRINELSSISKDTKLILKRKNKYKEKVKSSFDGVGTLLAIKSRNIDYDFKLSFLKLPKELNEIPKMCKYAIKREYTYDSWIWLLAKTYLTPNEIKKNPDCKQLDTKKIKKGYSKVQRFMNDYWNVPYSMRTITSELMKRINSYKLSYIKVNNENIEN